MGEYGSEIVNLPRGESVYPHGTIPSSGDTYITGDIIIDAQNVKELMTLLNLQKNPVYERLRAVTN